MSYYTSGLIPLATQMCNYMIYRVMVAMTMTMIMEVEEIEWAFHRLQESY